MNYPPGQAAFDKAGGFPHIPAPDAARVTGRRT